MNPMEEHLIEANRCLTTARDDDRPDRAQQYISASIAHSLLAIGLSLQKTVSLDAIELIGMPRGATTRTKT